MECPQGLCQAVTVTLQFAAHRSGLPSKSAPSRCGESTGMMHSCGVNAFSCMWHGINHLFKTSEQSDKEQTKPANCAPKAHTSPQMPITQSDEAAKSQRPI